jgi:hypothetical protein
LSVAYGELGISVTSAAITTFGCGLFLYGGKNLVFTVANFENKKMREQFPFPFLRVPQRFEPQKFPIYSPKESQVLDLNAKSYLTLFDLDVM